MNQNNNGPLKGIRVADFTQMMAGPFATQLLGDLGAEVIKIEKIHTGEWERSLPSMGEFISGQSPFFLAMNRNKKSIAIDTKKPESLQIIREIIKNSDVVINNFRPGAMDRMGVSFEFCKDINPDIVYLNSTGFGSTGPYMKRPGQDLLLQSISGLVANTGKGTDTPTALGTSIVDATTALFNVIGVLAGLIGKMNGKGSTKIDVNMLSSAISVQCQELVAFMNLNQRWQRSDAGISSPWIAAPFGIYPTKDGFAAISMSDLGVLAELLDLPKLKEWNTNELAFSRRDEIKNLIETKTINLNRDELIDHLLTKDIWCAPVKDFEEIIDDPQVIENETFTEIEHPEYGKLKVVAMPLKFSNFKPDYSIPAPMPGEHTIEILKSVGFDEDQISKFELTKVVSSWKSK
jgi:crotonobetainyl-CoA:carnitine CoA-transferase CaiB-like acyl-CoA transferase